MNDICPSADGCPIFQGILKNKEFTTQLYKKEYCEAGEPGREKCRRWQCKQKYGMVPDKLLPNSFKTLDQIGHENRWI